MLISRVPHPFPGSSKLNTALPTSKTTRSRHVGALDDLNVLCRRVHHPFPSSSRLSTALRASKTMCSDDVEGSWQASRIEHVSMPLYTPPPKLAVLILQNIVAVLPATKTPCR
uniref:Uncharacterized protein n=1 Tax=Psilocybe cubensis TaxID=181762 RepID=A0A8H7XT70_PSICU